MKKAFALLIVLFLITASVLGESAVDYFNSGNAKRIKGDVDGAIGDYTKAIELDPDYIKAYGNRGIARFTKGDVDGAIADYNRVIELKPDDAYIYVVRGLAKQAKGDWDGALADYNKGIELKPDNEDAYNNRGDLKLAEGDLDGALADYNKAIELKPDDAHAYIKRGHVEQAKDDVDGAIADYNRAINKANDLRSVLIQAYYSLALAKGTKGDLKGALSDCNITIELDPQYAGPYNVRGFIYYELHDFTNALVDLKKGCELNSSDYGHFYLWLVRARLGEETDATKELQNYWDNRKIRKPSDWLSKIEGFLTGNLSEAELFKSAENPDKRKNARQHCEAYFYAGNKRLIAGDKATAITYFQKCLATNVKDFIEYQGAISELNFLKTQND